MTKYEEAKFHKSRLHISRIRFLFEENSQYKAFLSKESWLYLLDFQCDTVIFLDTVLLFQEVGLIKVVENMNFRCFHIQYSCHNFSLSLLVNIVFLLINSVYLLQGLFLEVVHFFVFL